MSFSRSIPQRLSKGELDSAMRSIGMRIGPAKAARVDADIEVTLVSVVDDAIDSDMRALGVLVAWFEIHYARINVPRLVRLLDETASSDRARAFWSAIGRWMSATDPRFRSLEHVYRGEPIDLDDPETTAIQLARVGPDPRFVGSVLRVHAKLLRSRRSDVDDPVEVASRHALYRRRVELGSNYRADVWHALDERPTASPAAIAREVGCAYETARSVAADWRLHRDARAAARLARAHRRPSSAA